MEGKGGGGGGSEVRRLHIIYFLSHMGRVEHPHLVRVHHFTRTGVYLRDVKRWLGDLRGKDMPEAYAWSYKRRYKTGYVWQDLVDDDLITPLSDNEYVLKGSQIISAPNDEKKDSRSQPCAEKKATNNSIFKEQYPNKIKIDESEDKVQPAETQTTTTTTFSFKEPQNKIFPDSKIDPPSKIFSEINEESSSFGSDRSSLTDDFDSVKFDLATKNLSNNNINSTTPLSSDHKKQSKNKKKKKTIGNEEMEPTRLTSSTKSPLPAKRKSFSSASGASNVLRNLITCGAVDTNDNVLIMLKRSGGGRNKSSSHKARHDQVLKGNHDQFGRSSSSRVFRACWDQQEESHDEQPHRHSTSSRRSYDERKGPKKQPTDQFPKQRPTPAAYRPVREPNCSQCGKPFKPEKMHSHMKSCRGLKASTGKSTWGCAPTSMEKSTVSHSHQGSMNTTYKESLSYFLTN